MANIPSSFVKMNDQEIGDAVPVTQATMSKIGANINGLIDLSGGLIAIEYIANGSWTSPANVYRALVTGCGGGAGGANYGGTGTNNRGGGAAAFSLRPVGVVPGAVYNIVIGAGGGSNNAFGSASTFARASDGTVLASLPGGSGTSGIDWGMAGPFNTGNWNGQPAASNSGAGGGGGSSNNGSGGAGGSGRIILLYSPSQT